MINMAGDGNKQSSIKKMETGNTASLGSGGPIQSPVATFGKAGNSTSQNIDVGSTQKPSGKPVMITPNTLK